MRSLGIGFGWTMNHALLKLEPGAQVWEDLYPAGSILKITNAQVKENRLKFVVLLVTISSPKKLALTLLSRIRDYDL